MELTKDINFDSEKLVKNQPFTINYSGKLFKEGSDEVYITYGYGENWNNTTELKMSKLNANFSAKITPTEVADFNFCFKNNNNVWDNNSYKNYSVPIGEPVVVEEVTTVGESAQGLDFGGTTSTGFEEANIGTQNNYEEISSILDKPPVLEELPELNENKENKNDVLNFDTTAGEELDSTQRKTFNIDSIIDEILNTEISVTEPVEEIAVEQFEEPKIEKIVPNENPTHVNKTSLLVEDVLVPFYSSESTGENNGQFLPVDTESYSKFFTFRRKVKLALYKILHSIPKLLTGNFKKKRTSVD